MPPIFLLLNVVCQTMAHPRGLDPALSDNYRGVKFTAKKVLDLVKLLSAGRKLNEVHHEH